MSAATKSVAQFAEQARAVAAGRTCISGNLSVPRTRLEKLAPPSTNSWSCHHSPSVAPGLRQCRTRLQRQLTIQAQQDPGKVVREFSEETGKTIDSAKDKISQARPKDNTSAQMKQKMRDEYLGVGGSPDQPLKINYFVVISVVIASLAILTKVAGYI